MTGERQLEQPEMRCEAEKIRHQEYFVAFLMSCETFLTTFFQSYRSVPSSFSCSSFWCCYSSIHAQEQRPVATTPAPRVIFLLLRLVFVVMFLLLLEGGRRGEAPGGGGSPPWDPLLATGPQRCPWRHLCVASPHSPCYCQL